MKSKRSRTFLKYFLLLVLAVQLPFAFEVMQSIRLRSYLDSLPRTEPAAVPFNDVKGLIHVHSGAGGHSLGTYPEIIGAGKRAGAKWILRTGHPREPFIFKRLYDPDLLMIYGWEEPREGGGRILRDENSRFVIFSEFDDRQVPDEADGIEIFNLAESAETHNNLYNWINWIYHHFTAEEMFFFQVWDLNRESLDTWDNLLNIRPITATAGNDAHQNLGLRLETAMGQKIFTIQVDPYEISMKSVSNHLLLPPGQTVSEENVLKALKDGSSYLAFDLISDPEGFAYYAENGNRIYPPGSTVPAGSNLRLVSPIPVHFRIIWAGQVFKELEGNEFTVPVTLEGPYRVEATLLNPPRALEGKPWIITNPVYVKPVP